MSNKYATFTITVTDMLSFLLPRSTVIYKTNLFAENWWHIYVWCLHEHSLWTVECFERVNHNNVWRLTHLHCWKVPRSADSQTPLDKTEYCKLQSSVWESTDVLIMPEQTNQLHKSIYESVQVFGVVFFLSFDKNILWTSIFSNLIYINFIKMAFDF